MQTPLTVSFKEMPVSESIRTACWHEAEKLERYCDCIVGCHVTVARQHRQHRGNHFEIHVRLAVPRGEIVVSHAVEHQSAEKAELAIREAFDEVRRQLLDHMRRLRGDTKHHAPPETELDRGDACESTEEGFRAAPKGERLYRHPPQPPPRPAGEGVEEPG
jgi:ribosome-associated translation inhibitor RaiA